MKEGKLKCITSVYIEELLHTSMEKGPVMIQSFSPSQSARYPAFTKISMENNLFLIQKLSNNYKQALGYYTQVPTRFQAIRRWFDDLRARIHLKSSKNRRRTFRSRDDVHLLVRTT